MISILLYYSSGQYTDSKACIPGQKREAWQFSTRIEEVGENDLSNTCRPECKGKLILQDNAKIIGNVKAEQLVINEGAIFQGACDMNETSASKKEKQSTTSIK